MNILNQSSIINDESIKNIEKHYKATYVFENCLRDIKGEWCNFPAAIFYTEVAHPEGSNYFGIFADYTDNSFKICNALSATEVPIDALQIEGDIFYSRYRHDYRFHNGVFIDGGRDYTRYGGERINEAKVVKLIVVKDKLQLDK